GRSPSSRGDRLARFGGDGEHHGDRFGDDGRRERSPQAREKDFLIKSPGAREKDSCTVRKNSTEAEDYRTAASPKERNDRDRYNRGDRGSGDRDKNEDSSSPKMTSPMQHDLMASRTHEEATDADAACPRHEEMHS
ncbi:unnamed protein product, partial [Amoebophrya sp. A25]